VPNGNMKDIVTEMAEELTGIRLIAVVDSDSMVLACWESSDNNLRLQGLGQLIQQVNSTINVFKQSPNGFTALNDVILNTTSGYIIFKPICNGSCFIAVDVPGTVSLGSIRTVCNNFAPLLEQALPG